MARILCLAMQKRLSSPEWEPLYVPSKGLSFVDLSKCDNFSSFTVSLCCPHFCLTVLCEVSMPSVLSLSIADGLVFQRAVKYGMN